jgi:hypothetical protein
LLLKEFRVCRVKRFAYLSGTEDTYKCIFIELLPRFTITSGGVL